MKRLLAIGAVLAAWAAGVPALAMPLGVRMAMWGVANAQDRGGNALADALDAPELTFATGGDAEWTAQGETAHGGGSALKSGAIGDGQESWVEASVDGAGTVSFWWKASSEHYRQYVIDYAAFSVDGQERLRIGGEQDWTNATVQVEGRGMHVLRWAYVKDDEMSDGEDCAWLDNVVWTADDPLPPLDVVANDNDAKAVIAGLSDVRLAGEIGGTAAYSTFREWVDGNGLSHALVRDAPNAWLSYVLDAPGLMAKAALTSEDVVIESIAPTGTVAGAFDLVVDIAGTEIGTSARLADALGVEGATVLDESAFSSDGLTVTLERTAEGKIKATVTPDGLPPAFFLRVKVK